jgi:hypothetical protein
MAFLAGFENTIIYRDIQGRAYFRPWGNFGKCYLVPEADQRRIGRFVRLYYPLCPILLVAGDLIWSWPGLFAGSLAWMAGMYGAFGYFARGLPVTEPPARPTPAEKRELMRRANRSFGKPFVVTMLLLALAIAALSLWLAVVQRSLPLFAGVAFFGGCAAVFAWQLRNR